MPNLSDLIKKVKQTTWKTTKPCSFND